MTERFQGLLLLATAVATLACAQDLAEQVPRFEDYPVKGKFHGKPTPPVLEKPEEGEWLSVITEGVEQGWGVFDGKTGKEQRHPGPNFAGHYVIVSFGCGDSFSNFLGAAIVDARSGRVFRPPFPEYGIRLSSYFGMMAEHSAPHPSHSFHNFQLKAPLAYRVNSRLLIASICEGIEVTGGSIPMFRRIGCGAHYYRMDEDGLKLIFRGVE